MEFLYELDKAIFLFFNARLVHPVLDVLAPLFTEFSTWAVPGVVGAGLFVYRERKRALIVLGLVVLAVAITDQSANVIKSLTARPRPCHPDFLVEGGRYVVNGVFEAVGTWRSTTSFPSSHSANMFSVATLLYCFYPRRWMYFFAFAAMIGYTRVYCGVHYPFDVLAGAVFGFITGGAVYIIYINIRNKISDKIQRGKKQGRISLADIDVKIKKPTVMPPPIPLSKTEPERDQSLNTALSLPISEQDQP